MPNMFVNITLTAQDQGMSNTLQKAGGAMDDLGKSTTKAGDDTVRTFKQVAGAFTSLVVAQQAGRAIAAFVTPAIEMETALAKLQGLMGGTTMSLTDLRNAAFEAAAATSFTPTEAIEGLVQMRRNGMSLEQAAKTLSSTMRLAQASMGELGVAEAADVAASLMRELRVSLDEVSPGVSELDLRMGQLFASAMQFGVPMKELPVMVRKLGQTAAFGGKNLTDVLMIVSSGVGVLGSARQATTQLATVMGKLASNEVQAKLADTFGIFVDGKDTINPVRDIVLRLVRLLDQGRITAAKLRSGLEDAFGTREGAKLLAVAVEKFHKGMTLANGETLKGEALYEGLNKQLTQTNTLEEFVSNAMGTLVNRWGQLKEAGSTFLAVVGTPLKDVLSASTQLLMLLARGIAYAFTQLGPFSKFLQHAVGGLATLVVISTAARAATLALAGASRILAVGQLFAATAAEEALVAQIALAEGNAAAAVPVNFLGRAFLWLDMKVRGATRAFKGMSLALKTGLVGALLTVLSFLPDIVALVGGLFEGGDASAKRMGAQGTSVADKLISASQFAGDALGDAAQDLNDMSGTLSRTAKDLKSVFSTKIPKVDVNDVRKITKLLAAEAAAGRISGRDMTQVLQRSRAIQEAFKPGQAYDIADVGEAREFFLDLQDIAIGTSAEKLVDKTAEKYMSLRSDVIAERIAARDRRRAQNVADFGAYVGPLGEKVRVQGMQHGVQVMSLESYAAQMAQDVAARDAERMRAANETLTQFYDRVGSRPSYERPMEVNVLAQFGPMDEFAFRMAKVVEKEQQRRLRSETR